MNENKKKDELWRSDANSYGELIRNIGSLLETGKKQAVSAVNQAMVRTYWEIGKHIVEYEQAGNEKAEYGSETLKRLSRDLTERYGNGFGMSNINKMLFAVPNFADSVCKIELEPLRRALKD